MDDSLKLLKLPPCMKCATCFKDGSKFMYYFERNYYCIKCIDSKADKIKEYKFYI
jgi:hypothetical protein